MSPVKLLKNNGKSSASSAIFALRSGPGQNETLKQTSKGETDLDPIQNRKASVPTKRSVSNYRDFASISNLSVNKKASQPFHSGAPTLNHHSTLKNNLDNSPIGFNESSGPPVPYSKKMRVSATKRRSVYDASQLLVSPVKNSFRPSVNNQIKISSKQMAVSGRKAQIGPNQR